MGVIGRVVRIRRVEQLRPDSVVNGCAVASRSPASSAAKFAKFRPVTMGWPRRSLLASSSAVTACTLFSISKARGREWVLQVNVLCNQLPRREPPSELDS